MSKFRIYGNRTDGETALEKQNRLLAREAAAEGFVLLENDGTLPLHNDKVSLFGGGARLTVKGGTGSGNVRERYSVNIEEGLKNNGISIANPAWLDRFTSVYEKDRKIFRAEVEEAIKGYPVWKVMDMFRKIDEFHLAYPVGDEITDADLSDETETCIYVIARQAGEGADRRREKGDYLLSDLEITNLRKCRSHYEKLIVIINCGSSLDLSPLKNIKINALVYYGQAGEEGGNALAEVLVGKRSPSGHLTDTWAITYDDYPVSRIAHEEKLEENYEEGIYVGYRWFDAAGIRPMYPFGHGLSYTSFENRVSAISVEGSLVTIHAEVKNTGEREGKQVLLSFLFKPNVKYSGEIKSLTGFVKTTSLISGERDTVQISFDVGDFAVFDEAKSCHVLEAGLYGLAVGTDALNYQMIAALKVGEDIVTEQCCSCCQKNKSFVDYEFETPYQNYDGLPVYEITAETVANSYDYRLPEVSVTVKNYLDTLSDEELAMFTMGGGYFSRQYIRVMGACGNTTSLLLKRGIPNIIMSDGPAGINIMPRSAYTRSGMTRYVDDLPEEWQWGWIKKLMSKAWFLYAGKKDLYSYQYCTAWPNATTLAQSFNTSLVERVGMAIGREMRIMGITLWLAPALNIHRDPLCGRNFEYYSEDPIVSGLFASAITRGVQSNEGVGVTIKHFACNNREDDRTLVSSNLSERALREIYLKGFRIALREKPMALMSSYNRLNGLYTANNRELLVDILRCEWKYEGLVMSDWGAVEQCSLTTAIKCGNNMVMPGTRNEYKQICQELKKGTLTRDEVMVSALYALKMIFAAHTTTDYLKERGRI